jgi:hypothetical protein
MDAPVTLRLPSSGRHPIRIPAHGAVLTFTVVHGNCHFRYQKASPTKTGRKGPRPWSNLAMGKGDSWVVAAPEKITVVTNGGPATVQLLWQRWPRPSTT